MSNSAEKPWYSDHRQVMKQVDRWVSRQRPGAEVGQESDWLGWDAWVRTEEVPTRTLRRDAPQQ